MTPPTDEARLNDRPWSGEPTEPTPLPDETPFSIPPMTDEARAGEPRPSTRSGRAMLEDYTAGDMHPDDAAALSEWIAEIEAEAAAAPSLDVDRLRDALRIVYKSRYHERFAGPVAAEYARLSEKAP